MKQRTLVSVLSLVVAGLVAVPSARADFYIGGNFGFGFPRDHKDDDGNTIELDDDIGGTVAVGYNFVPVRIEGEFIFRTSDVRRYEDDFGDRPATGNIQNLGVMVNAIYDLPLAQLYSPYVGGGFGASRISAKGIRWDGETQLDDSESVFAYQFMAGIEYEIGRSAAVRLGYRFFSTRNPTWDDVRFDGSRLHIFEAGVRGTF